MPVLLNSGHESPGLFHRLLDRIEELLPQAKRMEVPGASHIVHEDDSVAFIVAELSFLKENSHSLQTRDDRVIRLA